MIAARRKRPEIKIPPSSSIFVSPGDVGRAFDYWLRVACIVQNRMGSKRFREFLGYKIYSSDAQDPRRAAFKAAVEECLCVLDSCYVSRRILDPQVLRTVFVLGYFERQYRTGLPLRARELKVGKESIDELKKLAEGSDTSWLAGSVILNPIFGIEGPKGVLAGDGDIIVDGALYDLKTSCEFRPHETLRQLLGYVVMNSMLPKPYLINSIGFYYVRFGWRENIPVSDLCPPEHFGVLRSFIARKLGGP